MQGYRMLSTNQSGARQVWRMKKMYKIFYSNHAVKQMFQRKITTHEVEYVLENGEIIQK